MHLKATKHVTASAVAQQTNDFKRMRECVASFRLCLANKVNKTEYIENLIWTMFLERCRSNPLFVKLSNLDAQLEATWRTVVGSFITRFCDVSL